jgi:hypothetical protein
MSSTESFDIGKIFGPALGALFTELDEGRSRGQVGSAEMWSALAKLLEEWRTRTEHLSLDQQVLCFAHFYVIVVSNLSRRGS